LTVRYMTNKGRVEQERRNRRAYRRARGRFFTARGAAPGFVETLPNVGTVGVPAFEVLPKVKPPGVVFPFTAVCPPNKGGGMEIGAGVCVAVPKAVTGVEVVADAPKPPKDGVEG